MKNLIVELNQNRIPKAPSLRMNGYTIKMAHEVDGLSYYLDTCVINEEFGSRWHMFFHLARSKECAMTVSYNNYPVGFACWDVCGTSPFCKGGADGTFGPVGIHSAHRKKGAMTLITLAALAAIRDQKRYPYVLIWHVGRGTEVFYKKILECS